MSVLLDQLSNIMRQYPGQEKLLLVSSPTNGYKIMESLAREGGSWINLRSVTPLDLAAGMIEPELKQRRISVMTRGQMACLLEQITAQMNDDGELIYFKTLYEMGRLNDLLLPSIQDLRLAMVEPQNLIPRDFGHRPKGMEIARIFNAYELALEARQLVDEAAVYGLAACLVETDQALLENKLFLIPKQMGLSAAAFNFVKVLQSRASVVLQVEEPVHEREKPFRQRFEAVINII